MVGLPRWRKVAANYLTLPVVRLLAKTKVSPDALTCLGLMLAVGTAVLIAYGHLFTAGFLVIVAGFFDMLDGALARYTARESRAGAVLDSVVDRISEAALLLGIIVFYVYQQSTVEVIVAGGALIFSFIVSYIRARAEALGVDCQVGLFTRTERVVVLALGLLLSRFDNALLIALAVITAFSLITIGQRLIYVWRQTRNQ